MKSDLTPKCLATGIGSLPHTEAKDACELILQTLPQIPFWPQLPKRSAGENMYGQYSENLPGLGFEGERMFIHTPEDFSAIEKFYEHFLSEDLDFFSISQTHAAGFYQLQEYQSRLQSAWAVKGQITGPISFTLQVTDENRRPLLYNDELKDMAIKNLLAKAKWQEKILRQINQRVIIFLDEPYLSAFGSAFTSLSREQAIEALEEVLRGISSYTGVHCCGNTDWSLLLETSVDILSFDAYSYASNLFLYESQLKKFHLSPLAYRVFHPVLELLIYLRQGLLVILQTHFRKLNHRLLRRCSYHMFCNCKLFPAFFSYPLSVFHCL